MCKKLLVLSLALGLLSGMAQAVVGPIHVPNGDFENYTAIGDGVTAAGWASVASGAGGLIANEIPLNDECYTNPASFGTGWRSNGPQPTAGKFGLDHPQKSSQNDLSAPFNGNFMGFMNLTNSDAPGAAVGQVQSNLIGNLQAGVYTLVVAVAARPSTSWNDVTYQISLVANPVADVSGVGSSGGTVLGTPALMTLKPAVEKLGSNNHDLTYVLNLGVADPNIGAPFAIRLDLINAGTKNGVANVLTNMTQANFDNVRLTGPRPPQVVLVTDTSDINKDGVQDDQGLNDWLVAQGIGVDFRPSCWTTLDTGKIAELNATDLIIVSRSANSADYGSDVNEVAQWNAITTPILDLSAPMVKSSAWNWFGANATGDVVAGLLLPKDRLHLIFQNVALDPNNSYQVQPLDPNYAGGAHTTFVNDIDANGLMFANNGTLLATGKNIDGKDVTWIRVWRPGIEFYAGAGQMPAGRRMYFSMGTTETDLAGVGGFDATLQGQIILLNAINYMRRVYPVAPSTDALLAQYLFDDGTANDSSGSGFNGILGGTAKIVSLTTGGGALSLDGKGKVDLPNDPNSSLYKLSGELTLAAWIRIDSKLTGSQNNIINHGHGGSPSSEVTLRVNAGTQYQGGTYRSGRTPASNQQAAANIPPEDKGGNWIHIATTAVYNSVTKTYTWTVYRNGVAEAVSTGFDGALSMTVGWAIGARGGVSGVERPFYGLIDEARIYKAGLSGSEIAYLASKKPGDVVIPVTNKVTNGSFEQPAPQVGFANVPGWTTTAPAANSGIQADPTAADGVQSAYLGGGDPSISQLSSLVVEAGKSVALKVNARNAKGAASLQMTLFIELFGNRVPIAQQVVALTDTMAEYQLSITDVSAFVGLTIGVDLANVAAVGTSLVVDNVRLQ